MLATHATKDADLARSIVMIVASHPIVCSPHQALAQPSISTPPCVTCSHPITIQGSDTAAVAAHRSIPARPAADSASMPDTPLLAAAAEADTTAGRHTPAVVAAACRTRCASHTDRVRAEAGTAGLLPLRRRIPRAAGRSSVGRRAAVVGFARSQLLPAASAAERRIARAAADVHCRMIAAGVDHHTRLLRPRGAVHRPAADMNLPAAHTLPASSLASAADTTRLARCPCTCRSSCPCASSRIDFLRCCRAACARRGSCSPWSPAGPARHRCCCHGRRKKSARSSRRVMTRPGTAAPYRPSPKKSVRRRSSHDRRRCSRRGTTARARQCLNSASHRSYR